MSLTDVFLPATVFVCFFYAQEFFLTWSEGQSTEDVVCCTDCRAHCGNVIVLLGCINKHDLI